MLSITIYSIAFLITILPFIKEPYNRLFRKLYWTGYIMIILFLSGAGLEVKRQIDEDNKETQFNKTIAKIKSDGEQTKINSLHLTQNFIAERDIAKSRDSISRNILDTILNQLPKFDLAVRGNKVVKNDAPTSSIKVQTSNQKGGFDVKSFNQQGGVTAGKIDNLTITDPPRVLNQGLINGILNNLPNKNKPVEIESILGDNESFNFAENIKTFMINNGYRLVGTSQTVFTGPVNGIFLDTVKYKITVGAKPLK